MSPAQIASEAARARRVDGYAQWIADDAQALVDNLASPQPLPEATAILAIARERVAMALNAIDAAIAADNAHHQQQEPA